MESKKTESREARRWWTTTEQGSEEEYWKELWPEKSSFVEMWTGKYKTHNRSYTVFLFSLLPPLLFALPVLLQSTSFLDMWQRYSPVLEDSWRAYSETSIHRPIITVSFCTPFCNILTALPLRVQRERFEIRMLGASELGATSDGWEMTRLCWIVQCRYAFLSVIYRKGISCGQDVYEWGFIICMQWCGSVLRADKLLTTYRYLRKSLRQFVTVYKWRLQTSGTCRRIDRLLVA
jgi:hypothetical protein